MQQAQCVRLAWRKRPRNTSRVELDARLFKFLLELKSFSMLFLLNLFKNLNLCTSYIKQIMNVSHSCNGTNIFIRWKMKCTIQLGFASLNGTFHLSPHENICTIALINIHYLLSTDLHKLTNTLLGNNTVTLASLLSSIQLVGESQLKKKKARKSQRDNGFLIKSARYSRHRKIFCCLGA